MASFSEFEAALAKAVEKGVLPGAVVAAQDKSGKINYAKAIGQASLVSGAERPIDLHTIFPLASMTKFLTSIAALQLIDRGLLTADTDITPYLPALAAKPILKSVSPPVTTPRTKPILLRHLLTHSSGLAYHFLDPLLKSYVESLPPSSPLKPGPRVQDRFDLPLVFEPGSNWGYGPGIDWAGHLVEVLTSTDLDTYISENLLKPLSLPPKSITFFPERDPSVAARVMPVSTRDETTGRVVAMEGAHALHNPDPARAAYGGEGGHADLMSYIEILGSILVDDGKLLRPETARLLFEPMLEAGAKKGLLEVLKDPWWIVGSLPVTGEYDHSLGGVVVDGYGHGRRRRGFLQWGGMFNLAWFIDREAGVTALFGTEVAQSGDPEIEKYFVALEEAVYAEAGVPNNTRTREQL